MTNQRFHEKIRISLENPGLQAALDGNAERRLQARRQAYASLPEDLAILRQRAHAVRARVIANLEETLTHFKEQASANGIVVHEAATAIDAVNQVLEIAHEKNARLIAKSKTMVGEEIQLNHSLEQAGLEVIETDLGEYIVQLRNEHPAHIITPAVHLRRSDVALTFSEKLGVPYNEDIPTMTAIARGVLRETFLKADIGISGVNFGVAESGALCLLTNEGNGRMVTTLPKTHIALMGIERLAPTLDDLALLLELLPRSATGQKLTVYTSLIHGPRRAGEVDGPEERHLILVDNGRRALLGSPLEEILYCIRCGACLNACPVFREIGGHGYIGKNGAVTAYPGPIGSVLSPGLFGADEFGNLARATSLCGACKEACPVDIDLPRLLLRVRAGMTSPSPTPQDKQENQAAHAPGALKLGLHIYAMAARTPQRFGSALRLAGWGGKIFAGKTEWLALPGFTGWGVSRDFPRPAEKSFRQRFAERELSQVPPGEMLDNKPAVLTQTLELIEPPAESEIENFSRLERFRKELETLGGSLIVCKNEELGHHLIEFVARYQVDKIQAYIQEYLPDGVLSQIQAAGVTIYHAPRPEITTGLTGALAGIAETGTLVLTSKPGQPMTASLLPEIHIAVLQENQIYDSLVDLFKEKNTARQEILDAPSTILITGPSRTADIEMTLTIGVHGPRIVQIFCLLD